MNKKLVLVGLGIGVLAGIGYGVYKKFKSEEFEEVEENDNAEIIEEKEDEVIKEERESMKDQNMFKDHIKDSKEMKGFEALSGKPVELDENLKRFLGDDQTNNDQVNYILNKCANKNRKVIDDIAENIKK